MTAPLLTLAIVLAGAALLWLLSLWLKDASIADIAWAPAFAVLAWVQLPAQFALRAVLILALVSLWAMRLGLHIALRHHGEDSRYAAMRRKNGPRWWWWSLIQVFVLQGVLVWVIAMPLRPVLTGFAPLGVLDYVGFAVAVTGFLCEAVADWQLTRFRADPRNKDQVMNRGLWSWSRHPNYFGDALMWWGVFLVAFAASHLWWLAVSPAIMTFLLLRVSGVAMLEATIGRRRPEYADYIRRTSAFVPLPPILTRPR
jgi:steroid 5-alpha reductase family enzyme